LLFILLKLAQWPELQNAIFPEMIPQKVTPLFQLAALDFVENWSSDQNNYMAAEP
jgi:hypothetical protein